jgi:hypothetical protein
MSLEDSHIKFGVILQLIRFILAFHKIRAAQGTGM